MKRLHLWASSHVFAIHPGIKNLVRWADGERLGEIQRHLERCPRCREQAKLMVAARDASAYGMGASEVREQVGEIYIRLQLQMQTWCSLGMPSKSGCVRRPQRTSALAAALKFYFGVEVAERIESMAGWNAREPSLIPATKPLFSTFLGKRAAEALAQKIASATT